LPARRLRLRPRLFETLDSEALPLLLLAFYGALLAGLAPFELVQDSWLTLVGGREVATHGIPHHDSLTVLSQGVHWVDQQWLAQLIFYELVRVGGLPLAVLVHVLLLVGGLALALAAARWRGAPVAAVFWVGLACVFLAPWSWQLRAQSFAYPLFVGVLWLLIADSRLPSRRVLYVLPLLVLWGNLHGSVVLGATLVTLRGVTVFGERLRGRASPHWLTRGSLLVVAPLAAMCSPYGVQLIGYYHHMLGNLPLSEFVQEWGPTTPQKAWLFYTVVLATLWLLGRVGAVLTPFERLALLSSVAAALITIRNVVWFELAAAILLPVLIGAWRPSVPPANPGPLTRWTGRISAAALAIVVLSLLAPPVSWYEKNFPRSASAAIASATRAPGEEVFASDRLADWILWTDPALRGRVAYDVRFGILTRRQLNELVSYHERSGATWRDLTNGYHVLVFDRGQDSKAAAAFRRDPDFRVAYRDHRVLVLVRGGGNGRTAPSAAVPPP
jgi:hypothetical protein